MLNPGQFRVHNPPDDGPMIVVAPVGDESVELHSDAGGLDIVEMALMGTVHFCVLARNNDMQYMGVEVFDAETGEKIAEAFTDDDAEIKDIAPGALRDKNPTQGSTVIKRMYPYAVGTKTYKPKARKNAKKKGAKRKSKNGARR